MNSSNRSSILAITRSFDSCSCISLRVLVIFLGKQRPREHEELCRFPIPRLDNLLDQISGATIFMKLDLKSVYYQICLRPGDEWKTTFKTREGLYEWPFIGKFVVVYFDDILIYSASFNEYVTHVRQVLTLLWKDSFYAATKKCVLMTPKVLFLGYVVSGDGIQVDESKVAVVQEWPTPTTITEVQNCIKGKLFVWTKEAELAFQVVKEKLTTAPILILPNFSKVFELHTDASKVAIGGVLSQVFQAVKYWRHYLFHKEFVLFTDHDSLRHICTQDKVDVLGLNVIRGMELHGEGHVGRDRTLQLVQASYFWPTMRKEVDLYVKRCRVCQVSKGTATNAGLYMPLHVPLQPWVDISMDFVLGLPHAVNVAQLFFRDVYRLHGLPSSIVSDPDTRFLSHFWRSLWKMVNTQLNFSSAYHPQTDGQTEVVNRSLSNLLRFSPSQVVYSAQPCGPLDLITPRISSFVPKKVWDFVAGLHDVHKVVHENLVRANSMYKQDADHKRRHVDFEEGDFIVEKMNSNAYHLKLPSHTRCSDVFNVKHLIPYHGDSSDDDLAMNSRTNFVYPGGMMEA
ncbi:putative reverse transcriptase domain-containing protein [Tanacetum coccineum]|uniref:Reverse transcriptase domain-containing protein n=1 Tax=Tanacetum coccineum TaxID=301880 RepID=A0ABQ4XYV0_9ASTR